jgi:hypothetical protein
LLLAALTLSLASCSDDTPAPSTVTPSATPEASPQSEVTPTLIPEPSPTSTWTPPPPVVNRPGEPSFAPGTDYPSVGLDEAGIPLAAEGTLVVYAKEPRGTTKLEVVVFDLARGERLSSFPLEANRQFSVQLAGNRILASFGRQLWSYALDGSDGLLLNDELPISYMLPSPDGHLVAITGSSEEFRTRAAILDLMTGDQLAAVDLVEELPDWLGEPHPTRWLDGETLLVGGLCSCDGLVDGFFDAIVRLDGSVERAPPAPSPTESIEAQIADAFDVSCVLGGFAGGRTVQIVDVTTGAVLAEATADAPIFLGTRLSPDGSEAFVTSLRADDELRTTLNAALTEGRCIDNSELPVDAPVLSLLTLEGGRLEPVDSLIDVLDRWHERLPVFVCGNEERAGTDTNDWLDPAPWRSPVGFGLPWGFTSEECQSRRIARVDMRIGEIEVDTDARGYRVLGFLQPE